MHERKSVKDENYVVKGSQTMPPSARWAMLGLSLSMLMSSLDTSIANAGLPALARAFSASFQQAQWIVLAYLLVITTLIVSVGRLGDIVGRRRLLLAGISLFTLASVLCGAAPSLWILIAARAAQGLGAAVMMSLTVAFVSETVPRENTGGAMGLLGTMSAIGTALGPSLGGLLISAVGWRALYLVNLPVGVLALFLAKQYLPADRRAQQTRRVTFDGLGTFLLAATLGAYALAMTTGHGHFGPLNIALLLLALLGLMFFVIVESRATSPLLHLAMFHDKRLNSGLVMSLLVSTVIMSTLVVGPFYLAHALRLDAAQVGLVLSVGPLVVTLCSIPAGRFADRFGVQRMTVMGLGGMGAGSLLLSLTSTAFGIASYVLPVVIMTAGYGLFQTANNTGLMKDVPADRRGVVSGMLNLSRNLGLITGASLMGAIFAFASGTTDLTRALPEAIGTGMRTTFAVAAALIALALLVAVGCRLRIARQHGMTTEST